MTFQKLTDQLCVIIMTRWCQQTPEHRRNQNPKYRKYVLRVNVVNNTILERIYSFFLLRMCVCGIYSANRRMTEEKCSSSLLPRQFLCRLLHNRNPIAWRDIVKIWISRCRRHFIHFCRRKSLFKRKWNEMNVWVALQFPPSIHSFFSDFLFLFFWKRNCKDLVFASNEVVIV